jgi:hypothetical protein
MTFIEARETAANNGHSILFVRKTKDEVVFKCEYCQAEMKFKESNPDRTWEGLIISKKCSKAPKKS